MGRREPERALQVDRQHDVEPDDRAPAEAVGRDREADDRIGQDGDRDQRLGRGHEAHHEEYRHRHRDREQRQHRPRRPRQPHAAHVQRQHERHAREHDQDRADKIEPVRALIARQAPQQHGGDRQRREPHRDIDPEDDRPVQMFGEEAAEQRPEAARGRIGDGEVGVVLAALLRCDQVAEHHHAHRGQAAAAESVQRTPEDQHAHVRRQRADQRARHVDQERDAQREPAAMDVGDLAVERDAGGRGEQVGGDQPRQAVDVAEVAPDGR